MHHTSATPLMFLPPTPLRRRRLLGHRASLLHCLYKSKAIGPPPPSSTHRDGSVVLQADLNATQATLVAGRVNLVDLHAHVRTANELLQTLLQAMEDHGGRDLLMTPDCGWKRKPTTELSRSSPFASQGGRAARGRGVSVGYPRRCRCPEPRTTLPDTTIVWNAYACKNYLCLVAAAHGGGISGCNDGCFDPLRGWGNKNKANRWARDDDALSYSIDAVLRARPNGTVRIGLDLGGGSPSGTFTAWMLERARVTVLTAAINSGAPFDSFVVSRGLGPLHVTAAHRLPLFDGTMDIVHAGHDLGGGCSSRGLFGWTTLSQGHRQLNAMFTPMIDRVGFRKLCGTPAGERRRRSEKCNTLRVSFLLVDNCLRPKRNLANYGV
ncbi:unnamed protein product [Miscanthus lutarioriparius]|uniref:Uncharacterized protein n=1 Tax=Miscanthus lutarioriparius TaxID=422564 RepID=A0A811R5F3_9POAL|nr:unnamed protein product [Miscanthus lutarioriparius]